MKTINVVVVEGRMTKDASETMRRSANGTAYGSFTIAYNSVKKNGDEFVEESNFIDVTGFGKAYESACKHMTKGSLVKIIGRIEIQKWTSDDGRKHSKAVIAAEQYFPTYAKKAVNNSEESVAPEPSADDFEEDFPFN